MAVQFKWFEREDGLQVKVADDKTKARLSLDKRWKAIAAPKGAKGAGKDAAKNETKQDKLGDDLKKAENIEENVIETIQKDAEKANHEAKDIAEAEEKKTVSKGKALTKDKGVKEE